MNLPFARSDLTRALAGSCAALAIVVALQFAFPDRAAGPESGEDSAGMELPPLDEIQPYVAPTFESFAEVLDRPLFYEDRKLPAPPEKAPVAEVPREPLQLVLEGVAISGNSRVALLRDQRSNELVQIAEGDIHDGWTLESVEGGKATFKRGDDTTELAIEVGPARNVPARRRPR